MSRGDDHYYRNRGKRVRINDSIDETWEYFCSKMVEYLGQEGTVDYQDRDDDYCIDFDDGTCLYFRPDMLEVIDG